MKTIVYKLVSPSKKYYIGSTCNFDRRLREHFNGSKNPHSLYIEHAVKKYGKENIEIIILEETETREKGYIAEQKYLDIHFKDPLCMNLKQGAKGFNSEQALKARQKVKNVFDLNAHIKLNPELKLKQAESLKQFYKNNPQAGISNSQKQRGFKYIEIISPEGKSEGKYTSIKELKKDWPQFISTGNISSCARGKIPHYKKYVFKYTD